MGFSDLLDKHIRDVAKETVAEQLAEHEQTAHNESPSDEEPPAKSPSDPPTESPSGTHQSACEYLVGDGYAYESIQEAYDAISVGEPARITITDWYDPAVDSDGIKMLAPEREGQFEPTPVTLVGQGPEATKVGVKGGKADTIHYRGGTTTSYGRPLIVRDMTIRGGANGAGLALQGIPFARVENVVFRTDGDGTHIRGLQTSEGGRRNMFGVVYDTCQAWNCGGTGFRLSSNAASHATVLRDCVATACRDYGVMLRGTSTDIRGGTYQLNYKAGIDCRGGNRQSVTNAYIEGNGRGDEYPLEVYVKGVHGFTMADCYFNGINPRSTPGHTYKHVKRGVSMHDSKGYSMRDCVFQNYEDQLLSIFGESSGSINPESHVSLDKTQLSA